MSTSGLPPFPDWLWNGRVVGKNVDGEALAVGIDAQYRVWLGRLNRHTNTWAHVREATQSEIDIYDTSFLCAMEMLGKDCRTTPPYQWRLP